jgi:hypothetical protein
VTIRNLGLSPCPRCLVSKDSLHLLGTAEDMKTRTDGLCRDDSTCQANCKSARRAVYDNKFSIDSEAVDRILKKRSLIITTVRTKFYVSLVSLLTQLARTLSQNDFHPLNLISTTLSL